MTFFPIYKHVCITKKYKMLFFHAKVHKSRIVSELLLFTHSAQKVLSKLLCSYRYICVLVIYPRDIFRDLYKCACCECYFKEGKPGPEHCHCMWSANQLRRCLLYSHLFGVVLGEYQSILSQDWKRSYRKFILKFKLRASKVEVHVNSVFLFNSLRKFICLEVLLTWSMLYFY